MDSTPPRSRLIPALLGSGLVLSAGLAVYLWSESARLGNEVVALHDSWEATQRELASSSEAVSLKEATIVELSEQLELTKEERDDIERDLRRERNRNEDFADQIDDLTGTVSALDKLSRTDRELLQKYSRVYFLNENFRPERLTQIPESYTQAGRQTQFFHSDAWPFLRRMMDAAERDDITLRVTSAFRSFEQQAELKGQYTQVYGTGANAFSADQGYSEHQLGTTADLTTPAVGGPYNSFAETDAYRWLLRNAHRYGFILSYPEGNTHYVYEPWHWRFVGVDLARHMRSNDLNFYDMDQREINEYLISIFD